MFAGSALTNGEGLAQERWTLGTSAQGDQRVEARAVSNVTGAALVFATFTAMARAGPVASLTVVAGDQQSALSGLSLGIALSVRARDQYANPVPNASVTFAVVSGGGTIINGIQTTDADGVATAGVWTLGLAEGTQTVAVTSGEAPAVTLSALARSRRPAQIAVVEGNSQIATVGSVVPVKPRILVQNATGDALPGVTVTFAPAAGSGTVAESSGLTDATGHVLVSDWTVGTAIGAQSLSVTAGDVSTVVVATATQGAPASLTVITSLPATAEVGSTQTFSVRAADRFGNPVAGAAIVFDATAGDGTFSPATGETGTDGTVATSWTLGTRVARNTARARVGEAVETAVDMQTVPASPARVVKRGGDDQSSTVGTSVAAPPSVLVEDRFSNPVPGATVSFVVGDGGGRISHPPAAGADGIATAFEWVLGTSAETNTLLVSAIGTPAVSFTAHARPGPVARLVVVAGDGQVGPVGEPVRVPPTVVARDVFDNVVPGTPVSFAVTVGEGSIADLVAETGADGTASVGRWTLGASPGQQALAATVHGAASVTFSATAQTRIASRIVADPSNVLSAQILARIAPGVFVTDQFGDPVQGISVTFSSPIGGVSGGSQLTDDRGHAAVDEWRPNTCSGTATLSAAAAPVAKPLDMVFAITTDVLSLVQMERAFSTQLNFSVDGGFLGRISAIVLDVCGRPMAGVPVRFDVTDILSRVDNTSSVTDIDGAAQAGQWRAGATPGVTTLKASIDGTALSGSMTATINHGAPARLVKLAGDDQSGPAGSTLPVAPSLRVEDQFGNPAPAYLGAFGRPGSPAVIRFNGLAGGTGTASFTAGPDAIVTASLWTLGAAIGPQSLLAYDSSRILSVMTTFTAQATAPPF